ncbi:MAG: hypothetical protein M3Q76_09130 [Acidobacteriota bacterium]|nr:hypothetical protein [Acidobacteriota bacterium]
MPITSHRRPPLFTSLLAFITLCALAANAAPQQKTALPVCDRERALLLVRQQAMEAKSFENRVAQISTLTRAADLLWPFAQDEARALFTQAFTLAVQHFRERGDEFRKDVPKFIVSPPPDQRFVVLRAIGRRDAEWARRLTVLVLEEERRGGEKPEGIRSDRRDLAEKIIALAESLVEVDKSAALIVARGSLNYPLPHRLPDFLYKLAAVDREAATMFYKESLAAYAGERIDRLMFLFIYPFALNNQGEVRVSGGYRAPENFAASAELQHLYLETLLRRAEQILRAQTQTVEFNGYVSEPEEALNGLLTIEPHIAERQPAYLERVGALKAMAYSVLGPKSQYRATRGRSGPLFRASVMDERNARSYESELERAERATDPDERDQVLTSVILAAASREPLEKLEASARKITGADTRRQVLVAVYYTVAQKAIFEGRFDDAMSIIAKVEAVEPRSQLAIIYALRVLNVLSDQGRARESLDAAKQVAAKAPDSNEKARALLGIAWVYAKFDTPRALEVLGESVRATNHVTEPRLNDSFRPNIVGRNVFHGGVAGPFVPVTPENTFRDVGARDFESALGVASELQDRPLRSLAILALSAPCLEQPPPPVAPKKRTPAAKEPSVRSKPLRERRKL